MKFLIDNQLPLALAVRIRQLGHLCEHVLELGLAEAGDIELWNRAGDEQQIVISKDEDFVYLANRPGDTGRVIWVRLGNCRNPILLAAFDRIFVDMLHAFDTGQRIVEVR